MKFDRQTSLMFVIMVAVRSNQIMKIAELVIHQKDSLVVEFGLVTNQKV